jgi:hypothetical protein
VSPRRHIQFDLLENARDSLRQAVQLLAWKDIESDHARLKHAITNAAHSIELLLKERLRQVNDAFVWENVDKFPNLAARTVTVDTAISRLKNIGGITLTDNDKKFYGHCAQHVMPLSTTSGALRRRRQKSLLRS